MKLNSELFFSTWFFSLCRRSDLADRRDAGMAHKDAEIARPILDRDLIRRLGTSGTITERVFLCRPPLPCPWWIRLLRVQPRFLSLSRRSIAFRRCKAW